MLDPAKRKCGLCYEDQEKYNIPIPNCMNPDGEGTPCEYPTIATSLMSENLESWTIWTNYPDQILQLEGGGMAGAIFTLNLVSLNCLMDLLGIQEKVETFRKLKVIFGAWRQIQDAQDRVKSKESERRVKRLRAENG